MEKRRAISSLVLIVLAAFFWLLPSVGQAVTVDCDTGGKIQDAIDAAEGRTLIDVSGTCNENVYILEDKNRITLDGGGVAIINGPDATLPTLSVRGRGIEIRNFNITGGTGIEVCRGGTATRIENNIIENTGGVLGEVGSGYLTMVSLSLSITRYSIIRATELGLVKTQLPALGLPLMVILSLPPTPFKTMAALGLS